MSASDRERMKRRLGKRRLGLSSSAAETEAVGAELAADLRPGDLVLVAGEMGAGKTTLIRGACRALGVEGPVTSPTFTIGRRYLAGKGLWVSHLDLYRLDGLDDEDPALLDDYLGGDSIAFVEWPAAAAGHIGGAAFEVSIGHAGGDRREIELAAASPRK
jgi:tRNA threonylcarbamoyladenosine biosynthesis protein TsaE